MYNKSFYFYCDRLFVPVFILISVKFFFSYIFYRFNDLLKAVGIIFHMSVLQSILELVVIVTFYLLFVLYIFIKGYNAKRSKIGDIKIYIDIIYSNGRSRVVKLISLYYEETIWIILTEITGLLFIIKSIAGYDILILSLIPITFGIYSLALCIRYIQNDLKLRNSSILVSL